MSASDAPKDSAMDPRAKQALAAAFLTLFIDLIGFSIIFPLFPNMLEYYRETETSGLFPAIYAGLEQLSSLLGGADSSWRIVVLFGGLLGSLYSILQFVFTPVLGTLSDRVGRKPVVVFSLTATLISYLLWFFAGNFALLLLARLVGGIASANIATVTAIAADVTTQKNRSRGMALVGMAFGLGFILGPAIGGFSSLVDLTQHFPAAAAWGVNPWSMPAAIAAILTIINLAQALFFLPETRPDRLPDAPARPANPLALFRTTGYPGVSRTNLIYFAFLLAFSGMEFSLTFLTVERLGFGPPQNAMMFLVVGLVLAGVQGGYVRRRAPLLGSRRVALHGLLMAIPALILLGMAGQWQTIVMLGVGIVLLATATAQVMPCLASLVSEYTPAHDQGRMMGVFRSLGALARALGPLLACVLYWRLGAAMAYYIGAALVLLPVLLMRGLPAPPEHEEADSAAA